jgi:hypothetical protein
MATETIKPKEPKLKRIAKGKRKHTRRLKQEARKTTGTTTPHA